MSKIIVRFNTVIKVKCQLHVALNKHFLLQLAFIIILNVYNNIEVSGSLYTTLARNAYHHTVCMLPVVVPFRPDVATACLCFLIPTAGSFVASTNGCLSAGLPP
jgi:hypothetical protein